MENELRGELGIDMIPSVSGKPNEEITKMIEDLAWQLFLKRTGLRFKRELTLEEKKRCLDVEGNENFRQEATRIYEKKQKALLNKKYPVIEVAASGKHEWGGGAYTLCFVYSKYKGNFVVKGYFKEVKEYLKKNYTHYFYNMSLWHRGLSRDIWYFWKDDIGIFEPSKMRKDWKFKVSPYSYYGGRENKMSETEILAKTFSFKRLPKRWIPEFDTL
jgi:hypothetical protein